MNMRNERKNFELRGIPRSYRLHFDCSMNRGQSPVIQPIKSLIENRAGLIDQRVSIWHGMTVGPEFLSPVKNDVLSLFWSFVFSFFLQRWSFASPSSLFAGSMRAPLLLCPQLQSPCGFLLFISSRDRSSAKHTVINAREIPRTRSVLELMSFSVINGRDINGFFRVQTSHQDLEREREREKLRRIAALFVIEAKLLLTNFSSPCFARIKLSVCLFQQNLLLKYF